MSKAVFNRILYKYPGYSWIAGNLGYTDGNSIRYYLNQSTNRIPHLRKLIVTSRKVLPAKKNIGKFTDALTTWKLGKYFEKKNHLEIGDIFWKKIPENWGNILKEISKRWVFLLYFDEWINEMIFGGWILRMGCKSVQIILLLIFHDMFLEMLSINTYVLSDMFL